MRVILLSFISLISVRAQANQGAAFNKFLDELIIPSVSYSKTPFINTAHSAVSRATELDSPINPRDKGMGKFALDKTKRPKDCITLPEGLMEMPITYEARNITLRQYLIEIARQAKLDLYITSDGLVFTHPTKESRDKLLSKDKLAVWSTIYSVTPIKLDLKGEPGLTK